MYADTCHSQTSNLETSDRATVALAGSLSLAAARPLLDRDLFGHSILAVAATERAGGNKLAWYDKM